MKKIISLFLAVVLVFSMTACGGDAGTSGGGGKDTNKLEYPFGVKNQPMEVGVTYPYKTLCFQNKMKKPLGLLQLLVIQLHQLILKAM